MDITIALIFPPARFLINEKVNPPLSLGYLSAYLKKNDIPNVKIYHITTNDVLPNIKADIIGIGFTTPQFPDAIDIVKRLRPINENSLFVAGGVHATSLPNDCLKNGFDTVVVGEGERAFLRVVKEKLTGVVMAEEIKNIDDIPFPDYNGIDIGNYNFKIDGKNYISMFTSRGCPFNCKFCASPVMWSTVRKHSVEYIKAHIDYLCNEFNINAIMFQDDVFVMGKERLLDITTYLKNKNITYRCLARSNNLDIETVDILVRTGCIEVGVGIESGSDEMLLMMNKKTTKKQNINAIVNCKNAGLSVKAFILLGSPSESPKTLDETFAFLEDMQPNDIDSNVLVLYPGTEFYQNITQYDIKQEITDWSKQFLKGKIGEYETTISTSNLTPQALSEYKWKFFNKFSKLAREK